MVASESLADELRPTGLPIHVVPPGRDVATAITHPGDLREGRAVAFLCVGNWVERKGILSLLEAFSTLAPRAGTLHLVGRTNVEPSYARMVWARLARADLRDRVTVHGPLPIEAVAGMYSAADVFVLPSLKEPYGTVYGEAMTFGLPVVGWRAGNLPYLAEHEREGLAVSPGDIAGLAASLQRLSDNASLRAEMGEAARRRAMARPTWDDVAALCFDHLRAAYVSTT
jgi:glycosyltransferase involved in cell wall biosynthesis